MHITNFTHEEEQIIYQVQKITSWNEMIAFMSCVAKLWLCENYNYNQ